MRIRADCLLQATSKEAFQAEDALQRQLAKKLGIKGKKRKAAPPVETAATEELDTMFAGVPLPAWHAMSNVLLRTDFDDLVFNL